MTFLYPLGFLALLAIPVLILIYIIKNRYTEQTVTSTYLWTLSERFLRRRIPINKLTGIISLILQILAVILIALIVAHPVLSLPGRANDYCFILDASGSMNIQQGGSTRFEEGKKKIAEKIDGSMKGSTYTIICVGETVYRSATFTDKEMALEVLEGLEVSYLETTPTNALEVANSYFGDNPSANVYLVTDRTYEETENIVDVINVIGGTENYALSEVTYTALGENLIVSGNVTSYGSDASKLTLNFYFSTIVNEETGESRYELYPGEFAVENVMAGESAEFEFTFNGMAGFESLKVTLVEKDDLPMDNEAIIYNVSHENVGETLIVYGKSKSADGTLEYIVPHFLVWALHSAGDTKVTAVTEKKYMENLDDYTGYGLYIFNNCEKLKEIEMPREGSVWYINPQSTVEGSNFRFQGDEPATTSAKFSTSKNTTIRKMLDGVVQSEFELNKYVKLGINGSFNELIRCDGNPLLVTGTNIYGNREVVFAFDLTASAAFTLHSDWVTLASHLLSYSFPEVLEQTSFYCGETLQVNVVTGCTGIRIETPLGNTVYPDVSTAVSEYQLNEAGVYTVYLIMGDNPEREFHVFASLPLAERELTVGETRFVVSGEPSGTKRDGIIDNLLIIFIILAVVAVADYGVYCYEQYQLR